MPERLDPQTVHEIVQASNQLEVELFPHILLWHIPKLNKSPLLSFNVKIYGIILWYSDAIIYYIVSFYYFYSLFGDKL